MPAITITQERPDSPDSVLLIGELQAILNQENYPDQSRHGYSVDKLVRERVAFFVTRMDGTLAGCGGIKLFGTDYGEVKRMFVRAQFRGLGLGRMMLDRLAEHARQNQVSVLRLETGVFQKEAIRLYEKYGFERRNPFGEYREDPLSVYFEKRI
jgi:ribosomal protein S18 acetylase RimI-like enzyme